MTDFQQFEVSYNGQTYISEFDFEAIKRADEMKVMDLTSAPLAFTAAVFYCSVLKNHPYANQRKVRGFFDAIVQDEEYGLSAFDDIVEEFTAHFLQYAALDKTKKKKKFAAMAPAQKVVNLPKAEK